MSEYEAGRETCPHAGGGVSTNWDPYGTRRKLGLPVYPWEHVCWDCWDAWGCAKDRRMRADTLAAVRRTGACGFIEAWVGHCLNATPCPRHARQRCWKCGAPAVQNCAETGTLVCGMPECADHPHVHGLAATEPTP